MAETTLAQELSKRLADQPGLEQGPRPQDLTLRLRHPGDVTGVVAELQAAGLGLATLVATDETLTGDKDFKVRYVFEPVGSSNPDLHGEPGGTAASGPSHDAQRSERGGREGGSALEPLPGAPRLSDCFVTLVVGLDPAVPELPSIVPQVPAANWHEREAQDLFGIVFLGHPDPKPLVVHDGWPKDLFPLRKSFDARLRPPVLPAEEFPHLVVEGEGVLEVPVGPIHAGIIEPGHFRFSTVGESVLNLEARLFYTHRGLEKRIEGLPVADAFYIAERMCGVCSVAHGLGFCEAAEQIAGVEVPARARVLRTLALELERLYNHVGDIGNIAAGASYHYGTSAGARMKEALQQVCERLSGSRFLRGLVVPGGARLDLTSDLERAILAVLATTAEALSNLKQRIENNPGVIDRLDTTGLLQRQDAVALAVTGVAARACGIDRDSRRDHPHAGYGKDVTVNVLTEADGDVHARLNQRAAEAHESIRLIRALLSNVPAGPICTTMPEALPAWRIGQAATESPRGAAIHWLRSDGAGRIDRYHLRSASYANWPVVPLAALTSIIPDFPLVNKSFELCYACTDR